MATLIDTDVNGNLDFALVAVVDGAEASVELHACDDTLPDGCGNAVLRRSYPPSTFCAALAAGPWNTDTMIEVALPFAELGAGEAPAIMTSVVTYAAASLLTSPKDSLFSSGTAQDYRVRVHYDAALGVTTLTWGVGSDFVVRRTTSPAAVRGASEHARVQTGPFDDLPGVLGDGQAYYYVVEKGGGVPVTISAHANRADGTVRLGFDDGDEQSAAVDPVKSTAVADGIAIPSDGTSTVTVRVTPRDNDGEPIGSGCDLGVDDVELAPGVLAGPVIDHRDGTYSIRVASTTAGVGEVVVSVEGIVLDDRPTVTFEAP